MSVEMDQYTGLSKKAMSRFRIIFVGGIVLMLVLVALALWVKQINQRDKFNFPPSRVSSALQLEGVSFLIRLAGRAGSCKEHASRAYI